MGLVFCVLNICEYMYIVTTYTEHTCTCIFQIPHQINLSSKQRSSLQWRVKHSPAMMDLGGRPMGGGGGGPLGGKPMGGGGSGGIGPPPILK